MLSLEDLLGGETGSRAADQISQNLGADRSSVDSAIKMALPALIGGLADNASSAEGAKGLNSALTNDHDGSLLGGLMDYLSGGVPGPDRATRQTDGSGILGHVLGNNRGQVAQQISDRTGLSLGQAANLLITVAPIVMSYLGKTKREQGLEADGISDLLTGQKNKVESSGGSMFDIASSMLDRDGDGSAMDDLASMAKDYFMK